MPSMQQRQYSQTQVSLWMVFYSCSDYPKCDYALWNVPVKESCPDCNWPILTLKSTKRRGPEKVCPQKECKYATPYEGDPEDVNGPQEQVKG